MKKNIFKQLVDSIKEAGKMKKEKQIKIQEMKKQVVVSVIVDLLPDLRYSKSKKVEVCSDACKFLNEDWLGEKFVGWSCGMFGDIEGYEGYNYKPLRHKKCKAAEKRLEKRGGK